MTAIEVARLRLQCTTPQRDRVRFTLEDALRTEIPDDGRLVLLRRLKVSPAGSSSVPGQRQNAMRDAWAAATGGARHGADDSARDANCVWFASREEAERVLVTRLLKGRSANAWFWKLALPGWLEQPVEAALTKALRAAIAAAQERRVLALAEMAMHADRVDVLIPALLADAAPYPVQWAMPQSLNVLPSAPATPPAQDLAEQREARIASMLTASLDPMLRMVLVSLQQATSQTSAAQAAIVRALALRHSPALALDLVLLSSVVSVTLNTITNPVTARRPSPPSALPTTAHRSPPATPHSVDQTVKRPTSLVTPAVEIAAAETALQSASTPSETVVERPSLSPPPLQQDRQRSRHAGIWLVIPSLAEMRFPAWLAQHADLLGQHPARQLMLAIARHHRVCLADPALRMFAPDPDEALPAWTQIWCHALDRWLRRTAHRRLHDLVNRPGALVWGELRVDVIFPISDADIRLRMRALDRDPGWTDWLGLSVRYQFSGEQGP